MQYNKKFFLPFMNTVIIQARMGSTRLPGKIMKDLAGHEVLWHVVTRASKATRADRVIVATTRNPEDDRVEAWCKKHNVLFWRGSSEDVLERYYEAAKHFGADHVVRVTSDCPLIDPAIIDRCIDALEKGGYDYISNVVPGERTFPRGLDVEAFSFTALERAQKNATETYEREHVTPHLWENKKGEFSIGPIIMASAGYAGTHRLTVDYPEDFLLMKTIYEKFYTPEAIVDIRLVIKFLDANPDIARMNASCKEKPLK